MPPFDGVPRPTRGVGFAKKLRGSGFHSVAIHGEQEDAELKVRDDTFCWEDDGRTRAFRLSPFHRPLRAKNWC